jgi:transposase
MERAVVKSKPPEIVSLTRPQLEELLAKLAGVLPAESYQLLEKLLRTLQWVRGLIEAKQTTIGRLQRLIFGAKTEKTSQLFPQPPPASPQAAAAAAAPAPKRKGHGRAAAADYGGAQRVKVPHPQLHPRDLCPACKQGKLYLLQRPAQIVRITAQSLFAATRFELEKLRCQLCGKIFTAPPPPEAGLEKYDPNVGPMLGYLRFGGGLPHYRLDKMQTDLGVRLPASTQWELMAKAGPALEPVQEALITLAAQGHLIHNDDTTMRVQNLAREVGAATEAPERTGIFTTGLLSEVQGHRIALFITGHRHAGENLDQLLARRASDAPPPIQMCDALSRNPSKGVPDDFGPLPGSRKKTVRGHRPGLPSGMSARARKLGGGLPIRRASQRVEAHTPSPTPVPPGAQSETDGPQLRLGPGLQLHAQALDSLNPVPAKSRGAPGQ